MRLLFENPNEFILTIEVVPPETHDPGPLLEKLRGLEELNFHAFSVASNPVARPRMSAMAFCRLIQTGLGRRAILHCTVRDHNRIGLQSELLGARALGLDTIMAVTGDPSAARDRRTTTVGDLTVFELLSLAADIGLFPGAVLDYRPEVNGLAGEIRRLERKVAAGCRFIVTQPVYDPDTARAIHDGTAHLNVPVIMGILPLLSFRHAVFLHDKVAGIAVPESLRKRLETSSRPLADGVAQAREMLGLARSLFSGACVMPPFERFEILKDILSE